MNRDLRLDHIRACAAFLVFNWHFLHFPSSATYVGSSWSILPLLSEGHTGVSLFMVLSGYLFSKIIDNKYIIYHKFIAKRLIRLFPLLMCMLILQFIIFSVNGGNFSVYWKDVICGLIMPTLPNGGWSITTEFHFYIILPFLIVVLRKNPSYLFCVIFALITTRFIIYFLNGTVQWLAYWTIVGRGDQFIFGIIGFRFRLILLENARFVIALFVAFILFYTYFHSIGGWLQTAFSPIWIVMPTVEGIVYGAIIACYDNSNFFSKGKLSEFVGLIGKVSYSIYMWHFFIVFAAATFIDQRISTISDNFAGLPWSLLTFLAFFPLAWLSYMIIERPFSKIRISYFKE